MVSSHRIYQTLRIAWQETCLKKLFSLKYSFIYNTKHKAFFLQGNLEQNMKKEQTETMFDIIFLSNFSRWINRIHIFLCQSWLDLNHSESRLGLLTLWSWSRLTTLCHSYCLIPTPQKWNDQTKLSTHRLNIYHKAALPAVVVPPWIHICRQVQLPGVWVPLLTRPSTRRCRHRALVVKSQPLVAVATLHWGNRTVFCFENPDKDQCNLVCVQASYPFHIFPLWSRQDTNRTCVPQKSRLGQRCPHSDKPHLDNKRGYVWVHARCSLEGSRELWRILTWAFEGGGERIRRGWRGWRGQRGWRIGGGGGGEGGRKGGRKNRWSVPSSVPQWALNNTTSLISSHEDKCNISEQSSI